MIILKEEILGVLNDRSVLCWSDVLMKLGLIECFRDYKLRTGNAYNIKDVLMGKTLIKYVDDILRERIVRSRDKRVCGARQNFRLNMYELDCLHSMPTKATEDINYMELVDL